MGAIGGSQNATILQANLPAVTLATSITDPGHTHSTSDSGTIVTGFSGVGGIGGVSGGSQVMNVRSGFSINSNTTGITASTALGGSGTAFKLVQPTIICNYILRII